jgi:hypothetical protein
MLMPTGFVEEPKLSVNSASSCLDSVVTCDSIEEVFWKAPDNVMHAVERSIQDLQGRYALAVCWGWRSLSLRVLIDPLVITS